MGRWLGQAMRGKRQAAGVTMSEIAGTLRMSEAAVSKFERAEAFPRNIDAVLVAYAEALGVDDSRTFWIDAIELWRATGSPPQMTTPSRRAADAANRAAERTRSSRPGFRLPPPPREMRQGVG